MIRLHPSRFNSNGGIHAVLDVDPLHGLGAERRSHSDFDLERAAPIVPALMSERGLGRGAAIRHVMAAALAVTLLNAIKPLAVDDPSYYWHFEQAAHHPLDPYGGEMFFLEILRPTVENVAPPVLVYWMALGLRIVGDHPQLLKLWLLPFAVLLLAATWALWRRFARGTEVAGVWLVALSPAILPSFNFMLDIPALALSLAAVALFLRAADRESLRLAIWAGVVAGLAMQTKYTGLTVGLVLLVMGWHRRQLRLALVACAVAGALFVGWEVLVHARYGTSQLLFFAGRRERGETGPANVFDLARPLMRMLGPLASPLIPLGLLGLGARRWVVIASIAVVIAAHLGFFFLPEVAVVNPYNLTLGLLGPLLVLVAVAVLWRFNTRRRHTRLASSGATSRMHWLRVNSDVRLLTAWLATELVAYFTITTFPAARRTLGVLVVLILITCRLTSRALRLAEWRRDLVPAIAALSVGLGLFYFAVDLDDAWSERATVGRIERRVAAMGGGRIWYLATHYGGFQFYAPRAGMLPVIPGRSWLEHGDWLVIPWNIQVRNRLTLADSSVRQVEEVPWGRRLPISTRDAFYRGTRPIQRPENDWRAADLYRVVESGCLVGVQEHPYLP